MAIRYELIKIEKELKRELEKIKYEIDVPSFSELVKLLYFHSDLSKIKRRKGRPKKLRKIFF